ncbi:MAG TPA: PDZ domain-containing protein [Mycobacteriales bacterium]|nr:PDZ domain-containing protein [Mycobacteriales bacterium]
MSRRTLATAIAGAAVVALTIALFVVPVPYAILSPGPVCNTLGAPTAPCPSVLNAASLITVSPASKDHPSTAKLGATTVSVRTGEPSIAEALGAWFSDGKAVVPREVIVPPGQSQQQVSEQGAAEMRGAQDSAVVAAEAALGLNHVVIASVTGGSAAQGVLAVGDRITALDGTAVTSADQLQALSLRNTDPAKQFRIDIVRDGSSKQVVLQRKPDPKTGTLIFGIGLKDVAAGVQVKVTLDPNAVGGPSAGLMLALGVYDRLTPGELAGSAIVAGTGTIDGAGVVGPIGGIQQKMYAARHDFHATVFLAPAGDCSDAKGAIPHGLQVVKVSTFSDALHALAAVKAGQPAGLPHC